MSGTLRLWRNARIPANRRQCPIVRVSRYDHGMQVTRRASVERNRLRFAAAHFATFREQCESLHGHNYDVTVDVEGPLTDDAWVCDFGDLKQMTRELAEQLDHKFLLQL